MASAVCLEDCLEDSLHYTLFFSGIIVVSVLCVGAWRISQKLRRGKAAKLAEDLEMELLACDNPNSLVVAGEINNRPSTIRYQKERTSLDHIRSGFSGSASSENEDLLLSVECDCAFDFVVVRADFARSINIDKQVPVSMLDSNGLQLESIAREKAAYVFEQPETVQNMIDLFQETGAKKLEVSANKINALIVETDNAQITSSRISNTLELLDRFARLLEFVSEEHKHSEN